MEVKLIDLYYTIVKVKMKKGLHYVNIHLKKEIHFLVSHPTVRESSLTGLAAGTAQDSTVAR